MVASPPGVGLPRSLPQTSPRSARSSRNDPKPTFLGALESSSPSSPRTSKCSTVAVSLRLRPPIKALDSERGAVSADSVAASSTGLAVFQQKQFKFAHVFDPSSDQADIFAAHREPVLNVLKGFDATLMTYGSTGAGKTHTCVGTTAQPGLMPRAFDAIFDAIDEDTSPSPDCDMKPTPRQHVLRASALEILEDQCVDLLNERATIALRASASGGLNFHGLQETKVTSRADLDALVANASQARTVAANYRHGDSSRSHFVLRLRVDSAQIDPTSAVVNLVSGRRVDQTSAVLTLVDLAGSEAALQNRTSQGIAQGITINKSLHWLKKAVHDLAARRIPQLRNSPLTRLLAPSLTGDAHVAIIVCSSANPPPSAARDALDALAFGQAAGYVPLSPKKRTELSSFVSAPKEAHAQPTADPSSPIDLKPITPDAETQTEEPDTSAPVATHAAAVPDQRAISANLAVDPTTVAPATATGTRVSTAATILLVAALVGAAGAVFMARAQAQAEEEAKAAALAAAAAAAVEAAQRTVRRVIFMGATLAAAICYCAFGRSQILDERRTQWERRGSRLWRTEADLD